jgi:hypothetical protein
VLPDRQIDRAGDVRCDRAFSDIDDLFELTARVVSVFPSSDELVVVPVGLCAMLPFNVGRTRSGRYLVEQTAVTLAPSLAWAAAAERARPAGPSFGAFCPGRPPAVLDLDQDRAVLEQAFPGASLLDSPTSGEVLSRLQSDGLVAHVSCHGAYDHLRPMSSGLELGDRLTLEAVLGRRGASWLVDLSAYETGVPDLGRSEQMISLPVAFLLGGAAHVIATLWPVGNERATQYNSRFYHRLLAGERPALAHRGAFDELRAGGTGPDPERGEDGRSRPGPGTGARAPVLAGGLHPLRLALVGPVPMGRVAGPQRWPGPTRPWPPGRPGSRRNQVVAGLG